MGISGDFPLDWAALAVSLFNTMVLLWLGLTVLLNAERRTPGLWVTGSMLLLGSLFFLSHSAILGYGLRWVSSGLNFWWHLGWVPVVALPFAWYGVILWYTGFWNEPGSALHRRQRPWLWLASTLAAGTTGMLFFANPLPSFNLLVDYNLAVTPSLGGIPLLVLVYPAYIVLCISLSLDALRHPERSERVMGELARRRARPWLVSAAAIQLGVSLLVGWVMVWAIQYVQTGIYDNRIVRTIAWFDLVIAALIGVAVVLVGQAIVSYEVFTGKTLPRRGLSRYWRRALVLAGGYGALVGWSMAVPLHPVYSLLLGAVLATVFFAMLSWRSFEERERAIESLRPFVTSLQLYDRLLDQTPASPPGIDAQTPFRSLCRDILGSRVAYLLPLGPLAPLAGPPLVYPENAAPDLAAFNEIAGRLDAQQTLCVPVPPECCAGASWVVPLWSDRGPSTGSGRSPAGALFLGEKLDGSLYSQEEIEIARAMGERLVDTLASAEIARRLMTLQRQRLVESQVLDRQARRVLHDEVLPELHAAMLSLGNRETGQEAMDSSSMELLAGVHRRISDLLRGMPAASSPDLARLGLTGGLKQLVENEFKDAFDEVDWHIPAEAEEQAGRLPALTVEVVYYAAREALRNAARHARKAAVDSPLRLEISARPSDDLELVIEDNGVGLGERPGGQEGGQGLALHSTMMAVVGGSLAVESTPGQSTRVILRAPGGAV